VNKVGIRRGQSVFINGCTRTVGHAAVQIAAMLGAHVTGSCGNDLAPEPHVILGHVRCDRRIYNVFLELD
jgi:NADPH-dependent curcumin reductase CurA